MATVSLQSVTIRAANAYNIKIIVILLCQNVAISVVLMTNSATFAADNLQKASKQMK